VSATKGFATFLTGLGVGICLALLFAPQSGEEFRDAITEKGKDGLKRLRKSGRHSLEQLQDAVNRGSAKVTEALNTSKRTLDALADRLE
jgi:gas vesicle protein